MSFTTATTGASGLLQPEYTDLVLDPLFRSSLALGGGVHPEGDALPAAPQLTTVHRYQQRSELRIPVWREDPSAEWVAEGQEIVTDAPELDEIVIDPKKVAGIVPITRELARDSTPEASQRVGQSLAREAGRKVDQAFFGDLASTNANAPSGLESLDLDALTVATLENLDAFQEAALDVATNEGEVSGWVAHPATMLQILQLKDASDSNRVLLENGDLLGRPLIPSPHVSEGTVWGLDHRHIYVALSQDIELDVSSDVYFTSDRVALKVTCRVGFGFPHHGAIAKVVIGGEG
ncbi:phage major capsid protein [Nesterenkonia xinjiangensis]|uniref:HK97 family phage major capsid protein n=1 Tax=Nesterenkonia xinjiangensis TaxID=225327 RepID=A0A7Z0GNW8_9MICC|nr:phage major capsid protein [Nesterenkonia xinjiangensis]NYJ79178.1 HK97 family phage major capsid protein [Nesterenkonia xinjiangensis]